jgi:hypothetical protein
MTKKIPFFKKGGTSDGPKWEAEVSRAIKSSQKRDFPSVNSTYVSKNRKAV